MQIIDLTHPIENNMLRFNAPWHIPTDVHQLGCVADVGRNTSSVTFGSHCGTHMDAALHFVPDGQSIDAIPLEKIIGPVSFVDCSHLPENHPVTPKDFATAPLGDRVIFYFNWSRHWGTDKFYHDYPFFTPEAAQSLIERGVRVLGMDIPSPDDSRTVLGSAADSIIHKLILGSGVTMVEYLANLEKVDFTKEWIFCATPLAIKGCDGSPVRACLFRC